MLPHLETLNMRSVRYIATAVPIYQLTRRKILEPWIFYQRLSRDHRSGLGLRIFPIAHDVLWLRSYQYWSYFHLRVSCRNKTGTYEDYRETLWLHLWHRLTSQYKNNKHYHASDNMASIITAVPRSVGTLEPMSWPRGTDLPSAQLVIG
jgi:hypothetical protein